MDRACWCGDCGVKMTRGSEVGDRDSLDPTNGHRLRSLSQHARRHAVNDERHTRLPLLTARVSFPLYHPLQACRPSQHCNSLKMRFRTFHLLEAACFLAAPLLFGCQARATDGGEASSSYSLVLPDQPETASIQPATPIAMQTTLEHRKPSQFLGEAVSIWKERNLMLKRLQYRLSEFGLKGESLRREVRSKRFQRNHLHFLRAELRTKVHEKQALFLAPSSDRKGRLIAFPLFPPKGSHSKRVFWALLEVHPFPKDDLPHVQWHAYASHFLNDPSGLKTKIPSSLDAKPLYWFLTHRL